MHNLNAFSPFSVVKSLKLMTLLVGDNLFFIIVLLSQSLCGIR